MWASYLFLPVYVQVPGIYSVVVARLTSPCGYIRIMIGKYHQANDDRHSETAMPMASIRSSFDWLRELRGH